MAKNSLCIIVTEKGRLYVGRDPDYLSDLVGPQKVIKTKWKNMPLDTEAFIRENPDEENNLFKALHYWALCRLKFINHDEEAYGPIKRKLYNFSKGLYRRIKNFATSIAAEFKKSFPSKKKQKKIEKKVLAFEKSKGNNVIFIQRH
jgi:hypothetical protein